MNAAKPAMFYAKEPGLTFFDVAPLKYRGWQEYEEGFGKMSADLRSFQLTLGPDFHATQAGDVAWATYTVDYEIQPKTGDVMRGQSRATDILEKRGEEWMIVHEHASLPMMSAPPQEPPHKATKAKAATHHKGRKKR